MQRLRLLQRADRQLERVARRRRGGRRGRARALPGVHVLGRALVGLPRGGRRQLPSLSAALGESVEFAKYEGLGNDFILIDDRDKAAPSLTPDQSERLCDRNFCVGGDGVIFALKAPEGEALVVALVGECFWRTHTLT